jgi:hypothetical protein
MDFREFLRVELDEFRFVFDVHEDAALAVGHGKFGFAAESERARDSAVRGVDRSGVLAAAVESEDTLGKAVVDDSVRIGIGLLGAEGLAI